MTSASLHTYAGLLNFYLAQPESARRPPKVRRDDREMSVDSNVSKATDTTDATDTTGTCRSYTCASFYLCPSTDPVDGTSSGEPNMGLIRTARTWFVKALDIDPAEPVAKGFVAMVRLVAEREERWHSDASRAAVLIELITNAAQIDAPDRADDDDSDDDKSADEMDLDDDDEGREDQSFETQTGAYGSSDDDE